MRVLHVLGELQASGAEVMLLAAAPIMREKAVEMVVVSTGETVGAFAAEYRSSGIDVRHVRFSRGPSFARAYLRLLREERPDVVHLHTERANAALGVLTKVAGVRMVVRTIHNVFAYTGRLRVARTVERALLRSLGIRHIAIGASVEQNEQQRLANRSIRVDNWIDERFRPPAAEERQDARTALGIRPEHLVITSVGNCSMVKNHRAIINALPMIAAATDRKIVYLHAGRGHCEREEQSLAVALPVPIEARFLGTVRDVRPLLWASDIYCMPSEYEGLSIAALEALCCGVPSVLSNAEGLREIHEATASLKFTKPTAVGIAERVAALVSDDERRVRRAADQVADSVQAAHGQRRQVERLLQIYQGVQIRSPGE